MGTDDPSSDAAYDIAELLENILATNPYGFVLRSLLYRDDPSKIIVSKFVIDINRICGQVNFELLIAPLEKQEQLTDAQIKELAAWLETNDLIQVNEINFEKRSMIIGVGRLDTAFKPNIII